jgi:hypothetical protein
MRVVFRITADLLHAVVADLRRPHPFAVERVAFLSCRVGALQPAGWVVLAHGLHPVADGDYLPDRSVGAMMGPSAIRKALQVALTHEVGMFHVHIHPHRGVPSFSRVDVRETAKFVPDFWHVRPHLVHGALVLSLDSATGRCWHPQSATPVPFTEFVVVGAPMKIWRQAYEGET